MKKLLILFAIFAFTGLTVQVPAQQTQDGFSFRIIDGKSITITRYTENAATVNIPEQIQGLPVTVIGEYAFFRSEYLTNVTIPSTVTSIEDNAFLMCENLTSVTIPSLVTFIGDRAFGHCYSLASINVDRRNSAYASVDGVLFNKSIKTLLVYPGGKEGAYTVPSSVTTIGFRAFYTCGTLTGVIIPSSVTSIGDNAFFGCWNLTSVSILSSVTAIGDFTFYECGSLTSVNIPSSVTSIGERAFYECSSLTGITIPASVTSIGEAAFANCESLTDITIPSSVTSIGGAAFAYCKSLTGITIPASVTSIEEEQSPFSFCYSLENIAVDSRNPAYMSVDGVMFDITGRTLIAYPTGRDGKYVIPSSVTSIGDFAFGGCEGLTSITIPSLVTSIGNGAFADCRGLTGITIPPSVTSIGNYGFAYCESLTSVTLSRQTRVGENAFPDSVKINYRDN